MSSITSTYLNKFPSILQNAKMILDIYDINECLDNIKIIPLDLCSDAGRWNPRELSIYINRFILELFPERLKDVLYHEIGHVLSHIIWGENGQGHGNPWQEVMIMMGQSIDTTFPYHFMEKFYCHSCQTAHPYSPEIFQKLRMGRLLVCKNCRRPLRITQEILFKQIRS
jgi:predicted SprT family Zn-dependent metalloprotease